MTETLKPLLIRFTEAERAAVEAYRARQGLRSEGAAVRQLVTFGLSAPVPAYIGKMLDVAAQRAADEHQADAIAKQVNYAIGAPEGAPKIASTSAAEMSVTIAHQHRDYSAVSAHYGVDAITGEPLPAPKPLQKRGKTKP